jgi:acetyl esterase
MTLDPVAVPLLEEAAKLFPPLAEVPLAEARARLRERPRVGGPEVEEVTDREIPGPAGPLRVRLYRPGHGTRPVVVFFHGGGWVLCDLDSHDALCRELADRTGAVVVSVDYRLAPEHPFPAAAEDAFAATVWVAGHSGELDVDPARVAVAGDSAGGNIAASVALMARDRGGPELALQLLVYPVLAPDFDSGSYRENAAGPVISRDDMRWFWDQYVADEAARSNPYASPLLAPDVRGVAPAHVVTAQHDPLRDEGEMFADRLRGAGVAATNTRYGGMFHGFLSYGAVLPAARQAMREVSDALIGALSADACDQPTTAAT